MTARQSVAAHERGSAIVFVLWIALFVSILGAGIALMARTRAVEVQVNRTVFQDEAILKGALDLAADRGAIAGRTYFNTLPETITMNGALVEDRRAPMNARIDINMADETAWQTLFTVLGASEARRQSLTDAILDWRDNDANPRPFGAEAPAYQGPGQVIGNRPFVSVRELAYVRGITRARLACMAPYLTVFGGTGPQQGASLAQLELSNQIEGVRVALQARRVVQTGYGRQLTGLVQYGTRNDRPYEWVRFGGDDGLDPPCPPGAFGS